MHRAIKVKDRKKGDMSFHTPDVVCDACGIYNYVFNEFISLVAWQEGLKGIPKGNRLFGP